MRSHLLWFLVCAIAGVLLAAGGLVLPAHLRAVDASVLREAGRHTPSLIEQGLALIHRSSRRSWRQGLRHLRRDGGPGVTTTRLSMPVYVSVRDYESGLPSVLTGFGFSPYMDRARFVKHTVALVREPMLMPAATRELRREIAVQGGRYPARRG